MRKQILIYKWLAAASVILVVFMSGLFYNIKKTNEQQLTSIDNNTGKKAPLEKTLPGKEVDKNSSEIAVKDTKSADTEKNESKINDNKTKSTAKINSILPVTNKVNDEALAQVSNDSNVINKSTIRSTNESISFFDLVEDVPAIVHGKIALPRLVLPEMPASFMNDSKNNKTPEDLWASVGFSAGSYNPGYSSAVQASSPVASNSYGSLTGKTGYSDPSSVGSAYSTGFAMSKRVFNRWVVQSGVNYVNQNIGYTSNYVSYSASNQTKVFVAEYADFSSQSVTITTPYQINSAVEVISLPFQTGYLLVDRKIGWQLNTGVAADFFMRNTLTAENGTTGRFSQSAGDKSPYRAVSWAGLLGTELSYKVARQYRISLVPSMRYSVNSVLKSTTALSSNPLVMDIGFRFRYIFK